MCGTKGFGEVPVALSDRSQTMEMPHILVAEDDPDTRELVEIVLRRADFRVTARTALQYSPGHQQQTQPLC